MWTSEKPLPARTEAHRVHQKEFGVGLLPCSTAEGWHVQSHVSLSGVHLSFCTGAEGGEMLFILLLLLLLFLQSPLFCILKMKTFCTISVSDSWGGHGSLGGRAG